MRELSLGRLFLLTLAFCLPGCQDGAWDVGSLFKKAPPKEPRPPLSPAARDPLLIDTIGAQTLLADVEGMELRGYGLVVGLGENGSRDAPTAIREYLIEFLSKNFEPQRTQEGQREFSASGLIDSLDSAVVEVIAVIPPGSRKGAIVDLSVQAVAGTQTKSLEGGLLLPCELRRFDAAAEGRGLLAGRALARANGPVFTNPFSSGEEAAGDPRRGLVLGGAVIVEDRPVRLLLTDPSYVAARQIERRINERFGQSPKAAEALSKGYVELRTPSTYLRAPGRFLDLVIHLSAQSQPGFVERKLRETLEMVGQPTLSYERLALIWEGMGRVAIPHIQPLYAHQNPQVAFAAARAGLRLGDGDALAAMGTIAADAAHADRLQAVRELGQCSFPQAALRLLPLVDSDDREVRVAAYEGLLRHKHPSIKSRRFVSLLDPAQTNFTLDVVNSGGPPLVFVRRTHEPRIVLFGGRIPVDTPVFYSHPDGLVTVSATESTGDLTVFGKNRRTNRLTERLMVPARLVDLITVLADLPRLDDAKRLRGLGLNYATVVRTLATLSRDGTIPAAFMLERTAMTDLFGPTTLPERPESETPPASIPPPVEGEQPSPESPDLDPPDELPAPVERRET